MRTCTSSSISLDKVDDYFSHLNPIAERIYMDMKEMKDTYGELWYTFNASEQNDITNETLINPEISLKYFDNFLSLSVSTPSVPKDLAKEGQVNLDPICVFDGRNLKTYGSQKVAMKRIQDDVLGQCRDEHSSPFSYRTKSQINLFNADIKTESKTALNEEITKSLVDYKIISELKKTIENKNTRNNSTQQHQQSAKKKNAAVYTEKRWDPKINVAPKSSFHVQAKPTRNHQLYLTCNFTSTAAIPLDATHEGPSKNHAVYTDVYCDYEENSNLMQNISGGNNFASSANTSDDDHYDYESEDVKLLDKEINLKKGFDFLNNW